MPRLFGIGRSVKKQAMELDRRLEDVENIHQVTSQRERAKIAQRLHLLEIEAELLARQPLPDDGE